MHNHSNLPPGVSISDIEAQFPVCEHELCFWCNECHTPGCKTFVPVCSTWLALATPEQRGAYQIRLHLSEWQQKQEWKAREAHLAGIEFGDLGPLGDSIF